MYFFLPFDFTCTSTDAAGQSRPAIVDFTRVTIIRFLGIKNYPLKSSQITGLLYFHLTLRKNNKVEPTETFFLFASSFTQVIFTTSISCKGPLVYVLCILGVSFG